MILKSTFTGVIESPDGNVTFTFKKRRKNEAEKLRADAEALPKEKREAFWMKTLKEDLIKVEGATWDDGKEVTVEDIKADAIFEDFAVRFIKAYYDGQIAEFGLVGKPKNAPGADGSANA